MTRIACALLLAVALPALAQQAPAEAPQQPAAKKEERRPLNLRLDNPSSFATTVPPEKESSKGLPALGGDARPIPAPKREGTGATPGGPFPKDTNPNL